VCQQNTNFAMKQPSKIVICICITKLENAILRVQAWFVGQRRQSRPTSGDIKDSRSDCHDKNQPIPQIFKTVVLVSVIPNPSLDTPLGPYCYTQCTACDKGYKFARHQYFTLKNCTKMPHDTDIFCCQPKIFH
jgi:hypothetical protein